MSTDYTDLITQPLEQLELFRDYRREWIQGVVRALTDPIAIARMERLTQIYTDIKQRRGKEQRSTMKPEDDTRAFS